MTNEQLRAMFETRARFLGLSRMTREGDGYKQNGLDAIWREWLACARALGALVRDAELGRVIRKAYVALSDSPKSFMSNIARSIETIDAMSAATVAKPEHGEG